ncbi:TPA: hypothetical protein GF082_12310 [Citrobacter braakii]|nr:hypothetical protein [Citrobacter braakii]
MNAQGRLTAASLARSQVVLPQRSDKHKVNVAIYRRQQIHYLRMCHSSSLTDKHYLRRGRLGLR